MEESIQAQLPMELNLGSPELAIGFAGIMRRRAVCECGHELGVHIPRAERLFAWPCVQCECGEYKEVRQ